MNSEYTVYKISLIIGSIMGMVSSNSIALFFGKFLNNKFDSKSIEILSNIIFICFALIGFANMIF